MRGVINIKTILVLIFIIFIIHIFIYYEIIESFYTKPTIVFLFSGNSRTSPFAKDAQPNDILESYNKYVFTEDFKRNYNYKVYITCDDIDIDKTKAYFGDTLGNIHVIETNSYLYKTKNPIKDIHVYLKKYNDMNWSSYIKYENSIYQHYKLLDAYRLFENDNIHCDYIVRLRMDTEIKKNIIELLNTFQHNNKLELLMDWDIFAIGKPAVMKVYCTGLDNKYGEYSYKTNVGKEVPVMSNYHDVDKRIWTYAPERQLFEMIFEYYINNNVDINTSILSIPETVKIIKKNDGLLDYF